MKNFFSKTEIPYAVPQEVQLVIDMLKQTKSQEECLEKVYEVLSKKYQGNRIKTYTLLFRIFTTDISLLWQRKGFLHCTSLNYLTRVLLVKSGFFENEDIENKWTLTWFISPHQYLCVRMQSGVYTPVDVWSARYGLGLGEYARGFN